MAFKIDTPSSNYRLDIYRMGYYGGLGARHVATIEPSATLPQVQFPCLRDHSTGLLDCGNWSLSATWAVPATAVSGIYFAKLVREDVGPPEQASHVVFIVRDDDGRSDLLFQTSDTTWQAYNRYGRPESLRASILAPGRAKGQLQPARPTPATTAPSLGVQWGIPMVRFLEPNGYDVSYFTGVDSDRLGPKSSSTKSFVGRPRRVLVGPAAGQRRGGAGRRSAPRVLQRQRSVLEDAVGDQHRYAQARRTGHWSGTRRRTPTRRSIRLPRWTGTWRDARFSPPSDGGRPENALTGTIFMVNCCSAAITVPGELAANRFWRNTEIATLPPGAVVTLEANTLDTNGTRISTTASGRRASRGCRRRPSRSRKTRSTMDPPTHPASRRMRSRSIAATRWIR